MYDLGLSTHTEVCLQSSVLWLANLLRMSHQYHLHPFFMTDLVLVAGTVCSQLRKVSLSGNSLDSPNWFSQAFGLFPTVDLILGAGLLFFRPSWEYILPCRILIKPGLFGSPPSGLKYLIGFTQQTYITIILNWERRNDLRWIYPFHFIIWHYSCLYINKKYTKHLSSLESIIILC